MYNKAEQIGVDGHSETLAFHTRWNVQPDSDIVLWMSCKCALFFWIKIVLQLLNMLSTRIVMSPFKAVHIDSSDKALIRGLTPDCFLLASFLHSTGILSWCNKSNYQRPLPRPRDREQSICYQTHTPTSPHTHAVILSNTCSPSLAARPLNDSLAN